MKILFDLFPLLVFFIVFKVAGIYAATAASIIASFIQVGWYWFRYHRIEPMHLVTLVVIFVFGGLTLILHDDTFIKWKPTIIYWIFGIIILGSQFVGEKPIIARILGLQLALPDAVMRRVNLSWGLFFIVTGALNLYVAFYYGLDLDAATRIKIWVNFKIFGLFGLTLAFTLIQGLLISKHMPAAEQDKS